MLSIRPASAADVPLLTTLILELAEYEHLANEAAVTLDDVARRGFGPDPIFRAVIAESDGQVAGYALFFKFFSSFQGRVGLLLDDIFVRPQFRRKGIGQALLAHVAGVALKEGDFCVRFEVLDWNTRAMDFFRKAGAVPMDEWKPACLIGDALEAAAEQAK